MLHHRYADKS